jgi:ubiquinone/menaquinone biosynthesis C-methylase UbiE
MINESDDNFIVYPNKNYYIDKPELYLLYKYENLLTNARMLDIGIGFGRTTYYFAEATAEYIGIDIQKEAVDFCIQKFKHLKNASFYVCDARDMKVFENNSFDVVFFSFNGIDYNSHSDRLLILKEMKRICKENGIIYFSSHNLQNVTDLYSFKFSTDPLRLLYSIREKILLKNKNPEISNIINSISSMEYARIYDGAQNFKINVYYISPEKQIEQLKNLAYKNIKVISLIDGIEVKSKSELRAIKDPWIHYLCQSKVIPLINILYLFFTIFETILQDFTNLLYEVTLL